MYRSNRSFNITLDNPPGLYKFWKTGVKIPPSPGQKAVQIPHHRSILGDAGDSNSVPDPNLERRGGGGRSSRPLDKGGGAVFQKNFFRAPGPQSGLKIRGDPGPSPGYATVFPPLCIGIKFPTSQKTMIFKFSSLGKSKVSIPWRKPRDRGAEASTVWPILQ